MKRIGFALAVILASALLASSSALAWNRSPATTFATLPPGATPPEGLTVAANGDVYVSTFGVPPSGPSYPGQVVVFDSHGNLLRQMVVQGASQNLLGLGFNPVTHDLLVLDFGSAKVLRVNPQTGALLGVFSDIGGKAGLNALTFDQAGNVYVSDSFQGTIWRIPPAGGPAVAWASDPLLTTSGYPPFGANGIAFNNAGNAMFVANTGDDSVVKIPMKADGSADKPVVLAYSINGADGLIIDESDNIWVAANQSDEIVVLDKTGKVIAKLGDFEGIDNRGAVRGLLFPASLAFDGEFLVVTNLVLDTRLFGFPTVDSQWAAQVTRYTVSKINRHLPPN
jgi:sugar lactone lactonase YvrE